MSDRIADIADVLLKIIGVGIGLGAIVGGGWLAITFRGYLGGSLLILAALTGLAFPVLLAYGIPLGKFFGEMLASLFLSISFVSPGAGRTGLMMQSDKSYELENLRVDEVNGQESDWYRFNGVPFAIGYTREQEAYDDAAVEFSEQYDADVVIGDGGTANYIDADTTRGGESFFVDLDVDEENIHVRWPEALSSMQDSAEIDMGMTAKANALKDFGGDTSSHSPIVMLAGFVINLVIGFAMSWLVFG